MTTITMDRPVTEPCCAVQDRRYLSLAEAMRRGARLGPQSFSHMYGELPMSSCALGAAVLGLGGTPHSRTSLVIQERLGLDVYRVSVSLPKEVYTEMHADKHAVYTGPWSLSDAIMTLNDRFRWGRERIADWVASLAISRENN